MLLQRVLALLVTLTAISLYNKDKFFLVVLDLCWKVIGNNETLGNLPGGDLFRPEKTR